MDRLRLKLFVFALLRDTFPCRSASTDIGQYYFSAMSSMGASRPEDMFSATFASFMGAVSPIR